MFLVDVRRSVSDAVSKILVSLSHFCTVLRHGIHPHFFIFFWGENLGWFQYWKAFSTNYHPYSSSFTSISMLSCNEATGLLLIIFPFTCCHPKNHPNLPHTLPTLLNKTCATKALENNWWPHPGKRDLQPFESNQRPMQGVFFHHQKEEHPGALRLFSTCAKESAQMTCKLASLIPQEPIDIYWSAPRLKQASSAMHWFLRPHKHYSIGKLSKLKKKVDETRSLSSFSWFSNHVYLHFSEHLQGTLQACGWPWRPKWTVKRTRSPIEWPLNWAPRKNGILEEIQRSE